jgi:hypothetical protein
MGLFLVAVLLIGCSGGLDYGVVSGAVRYDGKEIEDGAITFFPMDGKGPTAGDVIKGGKYSARVPVGTAKVSISGSKVVGKKKVYDTPDSPERPVTAEFVPEKYNKTSELRYDVQAGPQTKDFDLAK